MMSADFVPIYKGRDFYVPAFDIKIGGVDLPKVAIKDVIDVHYTDIIDQIDSFEITVNNWDAQKRDFKYTGAKKGVQGNDQSTLFDPGQKIELSMGYIKPPTANAAGDTQGSLRLMLAGIITSLTPNFPAAGQPTLKVRGQNVLRQLIAKQETHDYDRSNIKAKVTASNIAQKVGQRGNLKIDNLQVRIKTDPEASGREPDLEYVLQANQYDILFLLQLAHRHGYDVLLKSETTGGKTQQFLYFGPSTSEARSSYILEWGKSLIQFQPTLSTAKQVNEVTVRGWDSLKKKPIVVTVNRSQLKSNSLRDRKKLQRLEEGFKERKEFIVDHPFHNEQEARTYALGRLETLAKDMVTGHGSTIGIPDLRAGSIIKIQELGPIFDGMYYIRSTTHSMGTGGYTTEFDAHVQEEK